MNETALGHQIGIAAAIVYLLELLKRSGWFPWLNENSDKANRYVSIAAALLVAIGVTMNIQGNLQSGGTITIGFPAVATMLDGVSHFLAQLALQEGIYKTTVKG